MQNNDSSPTLLTEKEVAQRTNLSLATLRAHRFYRKGIPYVKIGRAIRYEVKAIEDFIAKQTVYPRDTQKV